MIALVVSLSATLVVYSRIKRQLAKAASVQLVVSSGQLEAGTQLAAENLTVVDWPASIPVEGAFKKTDALAGRILLYSVPPKVPIREEMLAGPGSAVGLTAKIPAGMRAVAVVTNELNNVSGFLFPGSHVDVLVTLRPESQYTEALTTTVLQNVEVLSAGERLQPDPSGKPQNVKVVTVLLKPDDAEKLMLASNQGTVQFVLRNSTDEAEVQSRPVQLSELRGNAAPAPVAVARGPAKVPRPAKSSDFEVEVFDGTKKGVAKF